ncbi:unnamed protein product [Schistocephalus solidus]|uniref:Uncharacterized protein n=1 Tax=Schistocephalus solidus TaxID=70667 RepID=A0A183TH83_SCHSO|nr:unnamed protein product [Schistocephalus solidus]
MFTPGVTSMAPPSQTAGTKSIWSDRLLEGILQRDKDDDDDDEQKGGVIHVEGDLEEEEFEETGWAENPLPPAGWSRKFRKRGKRVLRERE